MARSYGDPEGIRQLAHGVETQAAHVVEFARQAYARAEQTVFEGPAAERFRSHTLDRQATALHVGEALEGLSAGLYRGAAAVETLNEQARRQEEQDRRRSEEKDSA